MAMKNLKVSDSFAVPVGADDAVFTCREAVANLKYWTLTGIDGNRIEAKYGISVLQPATAFDVVVEPEDGNSSHITITGAIFGFGPSRRAGLSKHVLKLRNEIELLARRAAS